MNFVSCVKRIASIVGVIVVGLGLVGCDSQESTTQDQGLAQEELQDLIGGILTEEEPEVPEEQKVYPLPRSNPRRHLRDEVEARVIDISDGMYDDLSEKWKQGVRWLLSIGRCDRFDSTVREIAENEGIDFLLAKSQMIVESSCDANATSSVDARGIFQVKEVACRDVDMEGDLYDPTFNTECASEYRRTLCTRYEYCTLSGMLVAYNMGPTGARRVSDVRKHSYTRKIQYVWGLLIKERGGERHTA